MLTFAISHSNLTMLLLLNYPLRIFPKERRILVLQYRSDAFLESCIVDGFSVIVSANPFDTLLSLQAIRSFAFTKVHLHAMLLTPCAACCHQSNRKLPTPLACFTDVLSPSSCVYHWYAMRGQGRVCMPTCRWLRHSVCVCHATS